MFAIRLYVLTLIITLGVSSNLYAQGRSSETTLELEHSFGSTEGAGWSTEASLQKIFDLPLEQIPSLYKKANFKAEPFLQLDNSYFLFPQTLFYMGNMRLYSKINICYEDKLPAPNQALRQSLNKFIEDLSVPESASRLQIEIQTFSQTETSHLGDCSVYVVRGTWSSFPYSELKDLSTAGAADTAARWVNKVYGVYYMHNETSVPVITIHPDIEITYPDEPHVYVTEKTNALQVDGRALLAHELGHLIGFGHVPRVYRSSGLGEGLIMGVEDPTAERKEFLRLRFVETKDIWSKHDFFQIKLYRQALYRYLSFINKTPISQRIYGEMFSLMSDTYACMMPTEQLDLIMEGLNLNSEQYSYLKDLKSFYPSPEFVIYTDRIKEIEASAERDGSLQHVRDYFKSQSIYYFSPLPHFKIVLSGLLIDEVRPVSLQFVEYQNKLYPKIKLEILSMTLKETIEPKIQIENADGKLITIETPNGPTFMIRKKFDNCPMNESEWK